jgi:hypothetical protein
LKKIDLTLDGNQKINLTLFTMKKTKVKPGKYSVTFDGRVFTVLRIPGIGWVLENDRMETYRERTLAGAFANIKHKWTKVTGKN